MKDFRKRTIDLPLLARSLGSAIVHLPVFAVALLVPSTSRALREKVMLAVTSVNDCRYCSYVHTGLALANAVDLGELRQLLDSGTFGDVDERDAVATLFAQHFADTTRHPSDAARAALARKFNAYQRLEIMAYIHAIYLANLCGNSFDAWLERLSGRRVTDGHPSGTQTDMNELGPQLRASALVMRLVGWGIIIGGPIAALVYAPGFLWGELPPGFPLYGPQHPPSPLNGAHPYLYMMFSLYVAWAILLIRGAKDPEGRSIAVRLGNSSQRVPRGADGVSGLHLPERACAPVDRHPDAFCHQRGDVAMASSSPERCRAGECRAGRIRAAVSATTSEQQQAAGCNPAPGNSAGRPADVARRKGSQAGDSQAVLERSGSAG